MIKHIFFDLDRTLWDFEKNSHTTLLQLIKDFKLIEKGIDTADNFIKNIKYIMKNYGSYIVKTR
jgi:FMN phosphatase YigB (HAD superfamily)